MLLPPVDLASCVSEPIRVPGAIQPHGWLAASDASTGRIVAYSENCSDLTLLSPGPAQTAKLQLLIDELRHGLLPALGHAPSLVGNVTVGKHVLAASVHRSRTLDVFELEGRAAQSVAPAPIYSIARHVLPMFERATSLLELAQIAASELHSLSGFGRCLVYSFDEDGHGHVLAERRDPGYESYLGHAFPATDIPAQARALYLVNHIRLIPHAGYAPSGLHIVDQSWSARTIDLSFASLRSVSPVHLEYMRNMGTLASMSVSLVVRGKLWGLISCHNHEPRTLDFHTRAACEHLGELLSLQIRAKEENQEIETLHELQRISLKIVSGLGDSDATLRALADDSRGLLGLAQADGAAVVFDDNCWITGTTPGREQILALAAWIGDHRSDVYETNHLEETDAPSQDPGIASGVLAVSLSDVHRHLVVWFRCETARTIRWAGEPEKQPDSQGRLHPRLSFRSWTETVRGRSIAWSASEVATALAFRQSLVSIVLRHVQERAASAGELLRVGLARDAAEQADAAKTHFLAVLSHELRTPLSAISSAADVLERFAEIPAKFSGLLPMIKRNIGLEVRLIDDLLDLSAISAGKLRLQFESVDMHSVLLQVNEMMAKDAAAKDLLIHLDLRATKSRVRADPVRMHQIVWNILRNAVKFTGHSGEIRLRSESRESNFVLTCKDNGIGIDPTALGRIFRAFEQADADISRGFGGMGVGLSIAMGLVQGHSGSLVAQSEGPGLGATFTLSFPTIDLDTLSGAQAL